MVVQWNGLSFLTQELANLFPRLPGDNLAHATQSAKKHNNRGRLSWTPDQVERNGSSAVLMEGVRRQVTPVRQAGSSEAAEGVAEEDR